MTDSVCTCDGDYRKPSGRWVMTFGMSSTIRTITCETCGGRIPERILQESGEEVIHD
jgi:hypothetical protein